jgi:hypothetical protein
MLSSSNTTNVCGYFIQLNDDTSTANSFNSISGANNINGDQQQDSYMYPALLDEVCNIHFLNTSKPFQMNYYPV